MINATRKGAKGAKGGFKYRCSSTNDAYIRNIRWLLITFTTELTPNIAIFAPTTTVATKNIAIFTPATTVSTSNIAIFTFSHLHLFLNQE